MVQARRHKAALSAVTALVAVAVLALTFMSAAQSTADSHMNALWPKNVRGYVEDLNHNRIAGANVTVNMRDLTNAITKTLYYDSSEPNGLYTVTFDSAAWNEGYTIQVIAKKGTDTNQNLSTANAGPVQYVNVTLSIVIPEFGGVAGAAMPLASLGLAVVILVVRRRAS